MIVPANKGPPTCQPNSIHQEARVTLDTQLSVRFSKKQRDYLQTQLRRLRTDNNLRHFRWSESDLVRMLVNEAVKANRQLVPYTTNMEVNE